MTEFADDLLLVPRQLRPGQRAEVWIAEVDDGAPQLAYSTDSVLLEAPNWAPDGEGLLLNGDGLLWRLDLEPEVELNVVPIEGLPPINNDHVLDPPRGLIYLSANDGHIYVAPTSGGTARRVTHDSTRHHFLHGVSPDGATLAFVELPRAEFSAPGRLALVASSRRRNPLPVGRQQPPRRARVLTRRRLALSQYGGVRESAPAMHSWPGFLSAADPSNACWSPTRSTGSRTCRRTASWRTTSASRWVRSATRQT